MCNSFSKHTSSHYWSGMNEGDKLFCRAWIWIYLHSTPQPLNLTGACHCSVLNQRTQPCLQWLAGRNKAKWKHTFVTNIPTPGGDLGDELGEHHTRAPCMVGKVQSMEARAVPTLADDQVDNPPHCLREPSPHLALASGGARKSISCLLDSHPTGSSITINPHSASVSTIAWHNNKWSWAWLHPPRLPCTFEIKNWVFLF